MELENIYWSLFEGSGSIQAYLVYKEICATDRVDEFNDIEYKEDDDDINV